MDENVHIRVTSDMAGAVAALQQIALALQNVGSKGDTAGEKLDGMFDKALSDAGSFALALTGVQGVTAALSTGMRAVTAEYDNWLQRAQKAAEKQITFADAHRQFSLMLNPAAGDMTPDEASARILKAAGPSGDAAKIGTAFEAALNARGSLSSEQALQAVLHANRVRPDLDVSGLNKFSDAMMTMQRDDPTLSMEQILGSMFNLQAASRSASMDDFAQFTMPGITKSRGFFRKTDTDFRKLAGFQLGIGMRAEDPSGRKTATGVTNFLKQFKTELTKAGLSKDASFEEAEEFAFKTDAGRKVRNELLGVFGDMTAEELKAEGGDIKELKKLFEGKMGLHSEAALFIPLVEYLKGGDTPARKEIAAAEGKIFNPKDPRGVAQLNQVVGDIEKSKFQLAAQLQRNLQGANEQLVIPNDLVGARGALQKNLPDLLQSTGMSKIGQESLLKIFDAKAAFAEKPQDLIRSAINTIQSGKARTMSEKGADEGFSRMFFNLGLSSTNPDKLTAMESGMNTKLDDLITQLKAIADRMDKPQEIKLRDADGAARPAVLGAEQAGQ